MKLNIPTAQEAAEQSATTINERVAAYTQKVEKLIAAAAQSGHRSASLPDGMPAAVQSALRELGYSVQHRQCGWNEYEYEVTW